MKYSLILILILMAGCTTLRYEYTDPATGEKETIEAESIRRISIGHQNVTVIAGVVAINDETVQVLAKEAAPILTGEGN